MLACLGKLHLAMLILLRSLRAIEQLRARLTALATELAGSDRPEAITHALAGAHLLAGLKRHQPEAEQQRGAAGTVTVQLKLGSHGPALSWPLQPGLNRLELALPAQGRSCLVLELQGTEREQPLEGHDQRVLLAVLADLSVVHVSLEGHDLAATEQE